MHEIIVSLLFVLTIFFVIFILRYDWDWPYNFTVGLTTKLNSLKLLLQVIFCHPPTSVLNDGLTIQPIKFYFTDQTRVGTTSAGENAVTQMVGSLYDSIENDFGSFATRLYRAFKPKPVTSTTSWTWRHVCCLPYIVIFEFCFASFLVGISILTIYLIELQQEEYVPIAIPKLQRCKSRKKCTLKELTNFRLFRRPQVKRVTAHVIMTAVVLLLTFSLIANLYTWSRTLKAIVFSQRRHLQHSISKLETVKSEGFIQTLKSEVNLMTEMVNSFYVLGENAGTI